jgi:hypothetical protein
MNAWHSIGAQALSLIVAQPGSSAPKRILIERLQRRCRDRSPPFTLSEVYTKLKLTFTADDIAATSTAVFRELFPEFCVSFAASASVLNRHRGPSVWEALAVGDGNVELFTKGVSERSGGAFTEDGWAALADAVARRTPQRPTPAWIRFFTVIALIDATGRRRGRAPGSVVLADTNRPRLKELIAAYLASDSASAEQNIAGQLTTVAVGLGPASLPVLFEGMAGTARSDTALLRVFQLILRVFAMREHMVISDCGLAPDKPPSKKGKLKITLRRGGD